MPVEEFYDGWERIQQRLVSRLGEATPAELELTAAPGGWPVWALVAHLAVARVYWLCGVLGEPGAERTPFPDPFGDGWEDSLDHPRSRAELLLAVQSSWDVVVASLRRWSPDMLDDSFERRAASGLQHHTRKAVVVRLISHDAFHTGEVSLILGMHGRPSADPWEPVPTP